LNLQAWVGRIETAHDVAAAGPIARLAALLDHDGPPPWSQGEVPPLGHWLYFLPDARQRDLGPDGHPARGGFLPPVELPRRMWAGSRIAFHHPVPLGAALDRRSTLASVERKSGRSGELVFVSVEHEIASGGRTLITDRHDIVFRGAASAPAAASAKTAPPAADFSRTVEPDPVLLFRYSALTFNGHRIHYDRDWCRDAEGYPGLVVHGPLTATLLADLFLRRHPGARVAGFSFRGRSPLFDGRPFALCGRDRPGGAELWALGPDGEVAMTAELEAG
jgi:3-methylfumaryl-CoA hydratase